MPLGFRPGYAAVPGETKLRFGRGTGAESLAAKTELASDGRVGRRLGWEWVVCFSTNGQPVDAAGQIGEVPVLPGPPRRSAS